jgi:hypothetical protein
MKVICLSALSGTGVAVGGTEVAVAAGGTGVAVAVRLN